MAELVVDTDILIDCLRGRPAAVDFLQGLPEPPSVSAASVAELYAGVRDDESDAMAAFIDALRVVPMSVAVARRGGLLRRDYGPTHGTGLIDGIVAATVLELGGRLASLNARHYPMLSDVLTPY